MLITENNRVKYLTSLNSLEEVKKQIEQLSKQYKISEKDLLAILESIN